MFGAAASIARRRRKNLSRPADDGNDDCSEDGPRRARGCKAVAGQESFQRPTLHEVAESRAMFGPRGGLNEPDDGPWNVEARVRRAAEVGDEQESARSEDAKGLSEHALSLLFGVLVEREGEENPAERCVTEWKIEGRGVNEFHACRRSPTGGGEHRLRQVDARHSDSCLSEAATLRPRGAGDVEDRGCAFLAADPGHGRAKRVQGWIDGAGVDACSAPAVALTGCHAVTVDDGAASGKLGLGGGASRGENGVGVAHPDSAVVRCTEGPAPTG